MPYLRLVTCLAAALAVAQSAVAQAPDIPSRTGVGRPQGVTIPAKYHGVYAGGERMNCQEVSDSDSWLAVTAKTARGHESYCIVIAARRTVKGNEDELTFRCSNEGEKSVDKEAWSLNLERQDGKNSKIRQAYLLKRDIGPSAITSEAYRLKKCPRNVRPPY